MVAIGTLIAYWIDYGCLYGPDDFTWRFPIAFQCVFAVIVIIMIVFCFLLSSLPKKMPPTPSLSPSPF